MREKIDIKYLKIYLFILIVVIVGTSGLTLYFSKLSEASNETYSSSLTLNEIKDVAKLGTVEYLMESRVLIDDKGKVIFSLTIPGTEKTYIAVAQGQVTAGIDLNKISYFKVNNGKAEIKLPKSEILYKSVDPSTKWEKEMSGIFAHITPEEITKAEVQAQNDMVNRAIKEGILDKADSNAKKLITNYLNAAGVKEVVFE